MRLQMEDQKRDALRKRQEFWMNYLSNFFAQSPPAGENGRHFIDARERFITEINPYGMKAKVYEWDIPQEVLEEAEQLQLENKGYALEYATEDVGEGGN